MIAINSLVALGVIFILYTGLDSWIYRRPWALLLTGIVVAIFSVMLKALPTILKTAPSMLWDQSELEIAASIVDPLLVGLSGGLIASAFILKFQILHSSEVQEKVNLLHIAMKHTDDSNRLDEDLRLVASSLTNDEFNERLRQIKSMKLDACINLQFAQNSINKLNLPGL